MANMLTMPPSKAVAALTPKESGTSPLPPAAPKPAANALATNAMGNTAMTPQKSPYAAAMAPKPQSLVNGAIDGFMRGFRPEQWQADQDKTKLDGAERAKQTLALMQQQRQIPAEQRAQWWQQNADQIGQIVGADVKSLPMDANSFSDQALDGQIAMMSAKLGIAPEKPEAARYQGMGLGDGGVGVLNQSTGKMEVVREPTVAPPKEADPVKMETIQGKDGRYYSLNPYTTETKPLDVYGRVPGEGGAGRDSYRLASPQEVEAAGLPPGTVMKVNMVTNEPTILRNPSQTKEYDPVQIRQFKKSVSGLDLLNTTIDEYENTLKNNGGPQNVKGFWNVEQANAIEAARNNTLVLAKELYELGALVGADFSIIEAAIKPATGFESTGQTNDTLGASLKQVKSMLQNKMSQIPQEFVSEVRSNYSGPMANKFNAQPGQQQPSQPSFFMDKFQKATTGMQLPPGVTQEMWDVMDDEDKAAFQ